MSWQDHKAFYSLPTDDVSATLETDSHAGLSSTEATHRLRVAGPNTLQVRKRRSALLRFLDQFNNPLIYVLLVSGTITILLPGHKVDAAVIFAVVILNAIIGFIQEARAEAAIEALSKLVKIRSTVVRDGQSRVVEAAELVPGDLVVLQSGDRVPADLRIIRRRELQIDESMLTGESFPVSKETAALPEDTVLADRKNMAFSGTLVTFGQGTGVVTATGNATELGNISSLIESAPSLTTPLLRQIGRFSVWLSWVIVGFAIIIFAISLLRDQSFVNTFLATVAFAVAAIPEGLPAALTIILAIGVTRMAKRHAVIRKLPAVETLGSTTVICTDKTGTLTKNEMTVTTVYAGDRQFSVTGTGYRPEGAVLLDNENIALEENSALRSCLHAGVLCNDSRLFERDGRWTVEGDPTEGALLTVAAKAGVDPGALRDAAAGLDVIPFESERQYMATLHRLPDGRHMVFMKGAVEKVLALCGKALRADGETAGIECNSLQQIADDLAARGLRVLAFAMREVPREQETLHPNDLDRDMIFVGYQAMIDPPRPEAVSAVTATQGAGIVVKMITGDHALTARSIAEQCGISTRGTPALSGAELAAIPQEELSDIIAKTNVFARVAPEQKLRIVEALQARREVVAMTGDGVNDAPALKQANIGIAMGLTGTEVARDAADMVLTDDNFATIEAAVDEGRGVYENLRKFILWTLPTNAGEGLLILVAIALGIAIPVLPVQILWINMATAVFIGMSLAFEIKEEGLMQRPARLPSEPVLTPDLVLRIAYVSVLMVIGAYILFQYELQQGLPIEEARTVVANVVVLVETAFLFNCRSLTRFVGQVGFFSNPWTIGGALTMIGLQLFFVYHPIMNRLFQTRPVDAFTWLEVALVALAVFVVVEIDKWIRRRIQSH
jgi:magnesium-transporting ATPase (P-type)